MFQFRNFRMYKKIYVLTIPITYYLPNIADNIDVNLSPVLSLSQRIHLKFYKLT